MKTQTNISREGYLELTEQAIEYLKNNPDCYGCDLHHEIYNMDYFIIGYYAAEQWLIKNVGIFNAIDCIKEYEGSNFGEVSTDLSSSEKVVNMFAYIVGEEILSESETLRNCWNDNLTPEDCENIINELENI